MPCETCGCAVQMVKSEGATKEGHFKEVYECAQGHRGYVNGKAEEPATQWRRYGQVFQE